VSILLIGHEVVVDFLKGEPDQRIIIGKTYHETNQPPYKLPTHKTRMVIRSNTHKGNGFNEISFEDEDRQENIYVHAQRNITTHVEHNNMMRVDYKQAIITGHDVKIDTGNHHREYVGGNMSLWVGPNLTREDTRSK